MTTLAKFLEHPRPWACQPQVQQPQRDVRFQLAKLGLASHLVVLELGLERVATMDMFPPCEHHLKLLVMEPIWATLYQPKE